MDHVILENDIHPIPIEEVTGMQFEKREYDFYEKSVLNKGSASYRYSLGL